MNTLATAAVQNAVMAGGLYVLVLLGKSRIRNPAVLHVLLILVLLKLFVPPLWNLELPLRQPLGSARLPSAQNIDEQGPPMLDVPAPSGSTATNDTPNAEIPKGIQPGTTRDISLSVPVMEVGYRIEPLRIAVAVWGVGIVLWVGLAGRRLLRFHRELRFARPALPEVQRTADVLAEELGLRWCPRVWMVSGNVSPLLWAFLGRARILVPASLFDSFETDERELLLLHELAHARRRDHWVRWLELASLAAYWWNPIVRMVRRQLRQAEEKACDAWVIALRPQLRRAYAEMLVKTMEFLSSPSLPGLGTGVVSHGSLEERLIGIMSLANGCRISRRARAALCAGAIFLLPLAPVLVTAQSTADAQPLGNDSSETAQETELVGTVVDPQGLPVPNIEVLPYRSGERIEQPLRTDEKGQFRVPRAWRPGNSIGPFAALIVSTGESHLGWFDFYQSSNRWKGKERVPPAETFQIVLVPRTHTVHGTLVGPDSSPLEGIRVEVFSMFGGGNSTIYQSTAGADQLGSATTGADGRFSIALPEGATVTFLTKFPGWKARRINAKPASNDLGQFILSPGGRIEGRVVDAITGEPRAGDTVHAQMQTHEWTEDDIGSCGASGITDERGRFVLEGLSSGRYNVAFVHERGAARRGIPSHLTAPAVEGVDVVVSESASIELRVGVGRRLHGKVIDGESGQPLAGYQVGYYGTARPNSGSMCMMTMTDAQGTFEFFVPPGVGRFYAAEGKQSPAGDSSRTIEIPADGEPPPLILMAGEKEPDRHSVAEYKTSDETTDETSRTDGPTPYRLTVKLQVPSGRSVNHVEVRTVRRGSRGTSLLAHCAGTEFRVPLLEDDDGSTNFLVIDAAGFASARSEPFVVRKQMPTVTMTLSAEQRVPIRGRVIDGSGKRVSGARLRVRRRIYGESYEFPWGVEASTDGNGQFVIRHARMGDRIRLIADKPGEGMIESDWIELDSPTPRSLKDLQFGPSELETRGTILDEHWFPVSDAKVVHVGQPSVETKTDAEGRFRLARLPKGIVSLAVESEGYPREVKSARAGDLQNKIYVNRLNAQDVRDYRVKVELRPRNGATVAHVEMFLCDENGGVLFSWDGEGTSHEIEFGSHVRGIKGRFAILALADEFACSGPALVPNQRNPPPVVIDLEPAAAVRMRGRVVDERGNPMAGVMLSPGISLTARTTPEPWRSFNVCSDYPVTDAQGRFEFPRVSRNTQFEVYANTPGYSGASTKPFLAESIVGGKLPDIRLEPATGRISGRVVNEQGKAIPDANVFISDLFRIETTTDANGQFVLQQVPNRELRLNAVAEDGEWTGVVTPDAHNVEVTLRDSR